MVRPRLVEVGKPLPTSGGDIVDEQHSDEERMSDHSMTDADHPSSPSHSISSGTDALNHATPASSLLLALGSQSSSELAHRKSQRQRRTFRTVIGGTETTESGHGLGCIGQQSSSPHSLYQHEPHVSPHLVPDRSPHHSHGRHHGTSGGSQLPYQSHVPSTVARATHIEIGADTRPVERMEGVEDHSSRAPLVVIDGANVAYEYGKTLSNSLSRPLADARGIQVACDYFRDHGLRVLVVLTASWLRLKPQPNDPNPTNSRMQTADQDVLHELKQQGLVVLAPPTDDDDAYCLTIARRELSRAPHHPNYQARAFVLSNDLFRDAQHRDATLASWLRNGINVESGPGRISYLFCDIGSLDDHGERILDIVPNPRHPLIAWIEQQGHQV